MVAHFDASSLLFEQRLQVAKAEMSSPIVVLDDDHSNRVVRQQAEKTPAPVIDSRTHLVDYLGDLIPLRAAVGNESVRLLLKISKIRAMFRCRYPGIDRDGHRLLSFTHLLRRTGHNRA